MSKKKLKKKTKNKKLLISKKEKQKIKSLFNLYFFFFILMFFVVVVKVFTIEVTHTIKGNDLTEISSNQYTNEKYINSERGTIYDSEGNPMAVNVKEYKLSAVLSHDEKKYDTSIMEFVPDYIENPLEDAQKIIDILGYKDNNEATELIKNQLTKNPETTYEVEFSKYGENITLEEKEKLEESEIKGLRFKEKENRYYPYGDLAAYIVGYAKQKEDEEGDTYLEGEMGVEKKLDGYLKGRDGIIKQKFDKQGVPISEAQILEEKIDGTDVYLTIDSNIQAYVHDYVYKYAKGNKFDSLSTVVMDADTGEILGAEKIPSFSPNLKNISDYTDPYYDACIEPGSVIKTFLVSEMLKNNKWNPEQSFPSGIRTKSQWGKNNEGKDNYIADWIYNEKKASWGTINWQQGYYFSSNVGMTYMLDELGYDKWMKAMTETYEFGTPVQNQLYTSSSCDYSPDYDFEIANTSFGQGMTANIMQLLRGYTAFSGDGRMVNPHIIKEIKDPDNQEVIYEGIKDKPTNWKKGKNDIAVDEKTGQYYKQILNKEDSKTILDLLKGAVYYNEGGDFQGTGASYGKTTKYKVGSKTGTAQVAVNGNYANSNLLFSTFILAPIEDPEIIVFTSVTNPDTQYPQGYMKQYTGAIIDNSLDYLYSIKNKQSIEEDQKNKEKIIETPNLIGNTINKSENILKKNNLTYEVIGTGKVKSQYPAEDTKISQNQIIYIIGEDINFDSYKGKTKEEMQKICSIIDYKCHFQGTGNVTSIVENKQKIQIILKEQTKK